jgi:hypothetical protein
VPTLVGISDALGVSADVMLGHDTVPKPKQLVGPPVVDDREVRKLLRRLRKSSPEVRRLVSLLVKALEE